MLLSVALVGCGDNGTPSETCTDDTRNQNETDVDCGGAICGPCADGRTCVVDAAAGAWRSRDIGL